MELYYARIAALVAITLIYMLFDVFNRRNVPNAFVYATLAIGFGFTLLYLNLPAIIFSVAVSLTVLGFGYAAYRMGQLGGADVAELAAISLILPLQPRPILMPFLAQLGFPFIVSMLVNTGIVAIILVPLYYLPKASRKVGKPLMSFVTKASAFKAILMAVAYLAFIAFVTAFVNVGYAGIALLLALLFCSTAIVLFSTPITYSMIEYVDASKLEEGDIIAFNLMDRRSISALERKVEGFDRLVSIKLLKKLKSSKIREKLPVYKEAMPFALPIFIALLASLLLGNLLLFVLAA